VNRRFLTQEFRSPLHDRILAALKHTRHSREIAVPSLRRYGILGWYDLETPHRGTSLGVAQSSFPAGNRESRSKQDEAASYVEVARRFNFPTGQDRAGIENIA
jgi:hypothetical protein